jgi:hypothetical protein
MDGHYVATYNACGKNNAQYQSTQCTLQKVT